VNDFSIFRRTQLSASSDDRPLPRIAKALDSEPLWKSKEFYNMFSVRYAVFSVLRKAHKVPLKPPSIGPFLKLI
jgi:hypothetical protein